MLPDYLLVFIIPNIKKLFITNKGGEQEHIRMQVLPLKDRQKQLERSLVGVANMRPLPLFIY